MRSKDNWLIGLLCLGISMGSLTACREEGSIGPNITPGEVKIIVDSSFTVTGRSEHDASFDSRSSTMLLGKVDMDGVGKYSSSFVTQLLPAGALNIPDSIPLDSVVDMRLKLHFRRGALTGDSLAPCKLNVYELTKQLPADIQSSFDPAGYYNPASPLGTKPYVASALGLNDSIYKKDLVGHITIPLKLATARRIVSQYRTDPSVFQWPSTFNAFFPGLFVENSFGSGCMVNITAGEVALYYHRLTQKVVQKDSVTEVVWASHTDSTTVFSTAPEVLSSNNIRMQIDPAISQMVADGKVIVMSPCGYLASIHIPAQEVLDRYHDEKFNLAVISKLNLSIPARSVTNNFGLTPAPALLMVRRVDLDKFFADNKIPDNTAKSFYGTYNSETGTYNFSDMRTYINDLLLSGKPVSEEDMDFVLVPVQLTSENNVTTNPVTPVVVACTPYILRPTLCELDIAKAKLRLEFTMTY